MDFLCFSHLRWDFVYQRPQHLLSRAAQSHRVYFIEEPVRDAPRPMWSRTIRHGLTICVPRLPASGDLDEAATLAGMVRDLISDEGISEPVLWYYTPMALPWTRHLHRSAAAIVYDCMDHLAGFAGAPPGLIPLEGDLIARADLLFTGGSSLHELKRQGHPDAHCLPSSVDVAHFATARRPQVDPPDQRDIPRPRIGYYGVLDERIDFPLLAEVAQRRPAWQFVLVGPLAKIDRSIVPGLPNVHLLGPKRYDALPAYIAGWDVAMMPFARNEATRYISPTKTPEYLAAGRPVVSTSIRDVVVPYGAKGLVRIADSPADFIAAIERLLVEDRREIEHRADEFLQNRSWDATWAVMAKLVDEAVARRRELPSEEAPHSRESSAATRRRAAAPVMAE